MNEFSSLKWHRFQLSESGYFDPFKMYMHKLNYFLMNAKQFHNIRFQNRNSNEKKSSENENGMLRHCTRLMFDTSSGEENNDFSITSLVILILLIFLAVTCPLST